MDYRLFFILFLLVAVIAIGSIRKAGKIAFIIGGVLIAAAVLIGVVVFAPSSSLSIWFTEKISPTIAFDTKNTFKDGDVIITLRMPAEDSVTNEKTELSFYSTGADVKKAAKQFLEERVAALVEKRLQDLDEEYILKFKDSYMRLIPNEKSVEIIKGEPPAENTKKVITGLAEGV